MLHIGLFLKNESLSKAERKDSSENTIKLAMMIMVLNLVEFVND